jgi:hypothetical protein
VTRSALNQGVATLVHGMKKFFIEPILARLSVLEKAKPAGIAADDAIEELRAGLAAQKKEIAALNAVPVLRFMGVWKAMEYQQRTVVTDHGSWWHAECATKSRPGTDNTWKLAIKRGRDGRDLR